jgi:hypothetical protein
MHDGNCLIITNEVSAPENRRDIKLPDAAWAMGIQTEKLPATLFLSDGLRLGMSPAVQIHCDHRHRLSHKSRHRQCQTRKPHLQKPESTSLL